MRTIIVMGSNPPQELVKLVKELKERDGVVLLETTDHLNKVLGPRITTAVEVKALAVSKIFR